MSITFPHAQDVDPRIAPELVGGHEDELVAVVGERRSGDLLPADVEEVASRTLVSVDAGDAAGPRGLSGGIGSLWQRFLAGLEWARLLIRVYTLRI